MESGWGACSDSHDNGERGMLSVLDTVSPCPDHTAQGGGGGGASEPHLVPDRGWTPSGGSQGSRHRLPPKMGGIWNPSLWVGRRAPQGPCGNKAALAFPHHAGGFAEGSSQ